MPTYYITFVSITQYILGSGYRYIMSEAQTEFTERLMKEVRAVFEEHKDEIFSQADVIAEISKMMPAVNKILRQLRAENFISETESGSMKYKFSC